MGIIHFSDNVMSMVVSNLKETTDNFFSKTIPRKAKVQRYTAFDLIVGRFFEPKDSTFQTMFFYLYSKFLTQIDNY